MQVLYLHCGILLFIFGQPITKGDNMPKIKKPIPDGYLTITQASEILMISEASVRRWVKDKMLKVYILNGWKCYKRSEVDKLHEQMVGGK